MKTISIDENHAVILPRMRIYGNAYGEKVAGASRTRPLRRRLASRMRIPGETPGQRTGARRSSHVFTNHDARQYISVLLSSPHSLLLAAAPAMLLKVIARSPPGAPASRHRWPIPPIIPASPPRELELLQHLARGLSNEEVGSALGITGQAVKGYLKFLFPKLGAANRAEAVNRAHQLNLI